MFSKIISILAASTVAFSSSITDANIEEYKLPSNNYVQEAVTSGESAAKEVSAESTVSITIIDTGDPKTMRTTLETAHEPQNLGTLTRVFIMIKAIIDNPNIVEEKSDNEVISMVADYSKEDTDNLWNKYGKSQIIKDLSARYDLQETIPSDEWDKVQSSSVDISRLINRFLKDDKLNENQKNWMLALLRSTSKTLGDQDFTFGIPNARGVTLDSPVDNKIAWMQGSPMDNSAGLYKHSTAVFGENNRYIATIMVKFPDNTSNEQSDEIINKASNAAFSPDELDKSAPDTSNK